MSMCAVHMQKMKMSALGGIQSHNRREHESKKNKDIDYNKSANNHEFVLEDGISYQQSVKDRIADLNLKRAVRKDAVVYCSFVVSSDSVFFYQLGAERHRQREGEKYESVLYGIREPSPFEYTSKAYQEECIREGSLRFFEKSVDFFADRYGYENIINATVHFDEATPHLHIGIVPVTKDGRLSAKSIFTPVELKQLQTSFAEDVGSVFGLERGQEGNKVQHLDEVSFKLKKKQEQLTELDSTISKIQLQQFETEKQAVEVQSQLDEVQKAKQDVEQLRLELYTKVNELEQAIKEYKEATEETKNKLWQAVESRNDLLYNLAKFCNTLRITVNDKIMSVWDYFRTGGNTKLEHRTPNLIAEVYELHSKLIRENKSQNTPTRSYSKDNTISR